MVKKSLNYRFLIAIWLVAGALLSAHTAFAATPTVTSALTGSGDNVLLSVTGDPNSGVVLNYLSVSSAVQMSSLGTTNANGSFSITISTSVYGITPASVFYVTVNGQRSASMTWPYITATSGTNSITLSQTSVSLTAGQTSTITATNNTGGALYLSSNTNPSVANISINSNQIGITANVSGSTSVSVCSLANTTNCATFTVTVQSVNTQPITFSQNNVTVGYGQNVPIIVAGGTGTYSIVSNSNSSAVQASLNGSTVNLYAASTSGSAAITVCSSNMSSCGVINATASAAAASTLAFSVPAPSIAPGHVVSVIVSGGSGSYYVASNSNSSAVQANLVGSTLTLYGNSTGSATLSICASSGGCGTLVTTVAVPGVNGLSLGQTNVNLTLNQIYSEAISGIGGYYISSNTNPSIASAVINGSSAVITAGNSVGSTNITVCQSDNQCAVAYVTVSGTATATTQTTTANAISVGQVVSAGQGINLMLSGGATPYTVSSNSASVVTATLTNGNILTLYGVSAGTSAVNVCSANNGGCTTISVVVVSGVSSASSGTASSASGSTSQKYRFTNPLKFNSSGSEVIELQKRLTDEGVYSGPINGRYGALTEAAVKKYQKEHGLTQLGNVGPGTRAALNGE